MANTEEQEVWRTYPDYPFIQASNLGRVKTVDRWVSNGENSKRLVKGHILEQQLMPNGYLQVHFKVNGMTIHLYVHRIIAASFLSNPNNLPQVNHKDNDRTNNAVSNLEWCSRKYNEAYKKKFGTSQAELFGRPVIAINQENSEVLWFESQHEAARQFGINQSNISDTVNGKQNKTCGCWLCRADENAVEKARARLGDDIANKVEKIMNEHRN